MHWTNLDKYYFPAMVVDVVVVAVIGMLIEENDCDNKYGLCGVKYTLRRKVKKLKFGSLRGGDARARRISCKKTKKKTKKKKIENARC